MTDTEIQITYDTLIDLSRRERTKPELQKLDTTFYHDVLEYLREKQSILDDMQKRVDQFADKTQQQNTEDQLNNAKKLLSDIYERRERKIIEMGLNKSRTRSDMIDTSALLDEERRFFELLVKLLNKYRDGMLERIVQLKSAETEAPVESAPEEPEKTDDLLVRFLHAVPKFVGTDLAVYGPYEAEDVAKLAPDVAKVLIGKGRAEAIHEE